MTKDNCCKVGETVADKACSCACHNRCHRRNETLPSDMVSLLMMRIPPNTSCLHCTGDILERKKK